MEFLEMSCFLFCNIKEVLIVIKFMLFRGWGFFGKMFNRIG